MVLIAAGIMLTLATLIAIGICKAGAKADKIERQYWNQRKDNTKMTNREKYAEEIDTLDGEFHAFFDSLPDRTIVFGDRFPLRYFAEEFDLRYYAAFPGCSTQTEPSAATIAFLTNKVREEGISTVWYIEFSNHLVADAIAEAAGAETAMFHTCHNVSPNELAGGETYVTLMRGNLERLRAHLNER